MGALAELQRLAAERDDALARLTTAETERKKFEEAYWTEVRVCQSRTSALAAAEVRVEAAAPVLEAARRFASTLLLQFSHNEFREVPVGFTEDSIPAAVRLCDALDARAALACPPQQPGPGCKNHRGDPHNLCEACWAVEPDPATISVTQGGIGDTKGFFLPPQQRGE